MESWKSDNINELAAALAKAQMVLKPAIKGTVNTFFRSKYADLSVCMEAITEALAPHGLAISQVMAPNPAGVTVRTILLHESGQWLSSELSLAIAAIPPGTTKNGNFDTNNAGNCQAVGIAITYLRRYGAAAIVGLTQEDDDGEGLRGRDRDEGNFNGHRNGNGHAAPAAPAVATKPATDSRPLVEYLKDASEKCGATVVQLVDDLCQDMIETDRMQDGLRSHEEKLEACRQCYMHEKEYAQKTIKALVKHYFEAKAGAK